ncbi:MAG: hypothetical protein ACPGTQ_01675 [Colwellia sp.]
MNHCISLRLLFALPLLFCSALCFSNSDDIFQQIKESDFIFERSESLFPFMPIGNLQYTQYPDEDNANPELSKQDYSFDQFLGLPVWVGKKDMLILGETLSSRRNSLNGQRFNQTKVGVILGWMQQSSPELQIGAFSYVQYYNNEHSSLENSVEALSGGLVRYKHSPDLHTWYGLIYDTNGGDSYWLPYIGVDWMISPQWMLTFIPPWPSISYINKSGWITSLGIIPGQTRSHYSRTKDVLVDDFSYMNLGLSIEKELHSNIWLSVSAGYSGFGKFTLTDDQLELENDLGSTPFFRLSFNFRPGN